jgi:hypothetical protein
MFEDPGLLEDYGNWTEPLSEPGITLADPPAAPPPPEPRSPRALPAPPSRSVPDPDPEPSRSPLVGTPAPPPSTDRVPRPGLGIVLAAVGAALGAIVGGGWGAAAGALSVGVSRNALRARALWSDPAAEAEATKNASVAVAGLGIAAYCTYRAYRVRSARN